MCSVFFLFNLRHSTLLLSTTPLPSLSASSSFPVKLLFLLVLQLQLQLQRLGFNAQTRTDSLPPVCVFIHLCGFFPLCYYLANNNKSQPFQMLFSRWLPFLLQFPLCIKPPPPFGGAHSTARCHIHDAS